MQSLDAQRSKSNEIYALDVGVGATAPLRLSQFDDRKESILSFCIGQLSLYQCRFRNRNHI